MIFRLFNTSLGILTLIFLSLPFLSISCNDIPLIKTNGIELLTENELKADTFGKDFLKENENSGETSEKSENADGNEGEVSEKKENKFSLKEINIIMMVFAALVILSIVLGLIVKPENLLISGVLNFIALIVIVTVPILFNLKMGDNKSFEYKDLKLSLDLNLELGFWLIVFSLLIAGITSVMAKGRIKRKQELEETYNAIRNQINNNQINPLS